MLVTEFSTEIVAARERFELFAEVTDQAHMPNRLRSNNQDDFRARIRILDFGELQVSMMHIPHLEVTRTAKLIRQFDPEAYQINYFLHQTGLLSLAGADTALSKGDLVMMDSSRPYRGEVRPLGPGWSHVTVQLPRRLIPLPERTVQRLLTVPIDGRRGMGGTFGRWLTDINARADEFTAADTPALAQLTTDLLASTLSRALDVEDALSPEARRRALRLRVHAFIRQHLRDPALTPDTIAAAHAVSTRHLYRLFEEEGITIAAWIRERRLEQCRNDLADPNLRNIPARAIAARWNFADPAHFSRTFRAAYGAAPSDYRQAVLNRSCGN
ncbi:helix-turn-helix domain-containing protein [Streptomyces sp. GMY02]|uniref:AraC-like ligand-binding domain-containing protein n=1 Tax=Streptomyces sp. GMY02 TaxID=1333528 RepID=UPI001C2B81D3|nr:helix-turn-helix domain-containing protein [Streptomyces sp. GMY02]QXE38742.1 helix-turn-helix domain-containing protein [Streptomyces sp. GMY02]